MQRNDTTPGAGPPQAATSEVPDEQLWSWVDRDAPELGLHLEEYPGDRSRVDELRRAIRAVAGDSRDAHTPDRIGPYPIRGRVGSGGMGVVFEGTQVRTNRRVAIKVIRGAWLDDERTRRLFFREAEVLARLQHPGIAAIHDAGETKEGAPYFVMELVDGLPLDQWAKGQSLTERLEVAHQIAEAVEHAHQKGVIHRDLKPSNVLVTANGTAKVLDFGLARIVDPSANASLTAAISGNVIGTVRYMSPEQARGLASRVTPASDVYSIGVLMYELVTGRLPHDFEGSDLFECARKVAEEKIDPPSKHTAALEPALDSVICQTLAKDPAKRYASAAELAADIRRVLDGLPVKAKSPQQRGEDLGELLGRWGVELGTALGRASAELCDVTRSVMDSENTQKAKKAASTASKRAQEAAQTAAKQAREGAQKVSQHLKERKARRGGPAGPPSDDGRSEDGTRVETVHIDLVPAIDFAAKSAAVTAKAAKATAKMSAKGARAAGRGVRRMLPRKRTVAAWVFAILLINSFALFAVNGFRVDRTLDDAAELVTDGVEEVGEALAGVWREIF